ncbi:hypothetical protein [Polyangium sp. 15x6]|uniref:hypothetical protein n=1 Tax=Polyangium sp. 15x6 TaxID=3042687 RepID=UPI00249BD2D1|nr:hypothetical protein [Polyangium sp. 15x6]MDI3285153.1 hypothetical protein [Polyangium sp. 15x6]
MDTWETIETVAFLGKLFVKYKREPTAIAVDLLKAVAAAATMAGVELDVMLDAVRTGAGKRPGVSGR